MPNNNPWTVGEILAALILRQDGRTLTPAGAHHRRHNLPHRFINVGAGLVAPVGLDGNPCGYRPGQRDMFSVPHLHFAENLLDRKFLILNEFLYVDQDSLFDRSPAARRTYATRAHLVMRQIGLPPPKMPSNMFCRIRRALEIESGVAK